MTRVVLVMVAALSIGAAAGAQPVERRVELELGSGARVALVVTLQPDHASQADRIVDAARESLDQYSEWFAPYPFDHLTITDVPWQSTLDDRPQPAVANIRARWLQPERSLTIEGQVARAIARQWWGVLVQMPDRFLADGLAEYAQSRVLERIFDRRHQRINYSLYEARFFGGLVPWAIRGLRLDRQTSGIGRPAFRRDPLVDVHAGGEAVRAAQTAKTATALVTLERYLGWQAFQRGLGNAARRFSGKVMTAVAFYETVGDAAGRDLSWYFDQAFGRPATFDFAVSRLTSVAGEPGACGPGPCYRTTVVLSRLGDALFTGTSQQPAGTFEAGRGLEVDVTFADGQHARDHWDGRASSKTLDYEGPSPATSARIDPARILMLDLHSQNNRRTLAPLARTAALAWSVRWTVWLQDFMSSYAFFF